MKQFLLADKWRAACLGLVVLVSLSGIGRLAWNTYWLHRWQNETLYHLAQNQAAIIQYLNTHPIK